MSDQDLSQRLEVAYRIGQEAGQLIMGYFADSVAVERKSDDSPVTVADRDAEIYLRNEIEVAFPQDAIIGEEHAATEGSSSYRWILDPIDGTKSFIAGVPLFGTLIGVQRDGESVIGVIELPGLNQRVFAAEGSGAWYQSGSSPLEHANVSDCRSLRNGRYLTSEVGSYGERDAMSVHHRLEQAAWYARTWGDCYGYFLVATGRAEVMVDPAMNLWDAAALMPVLTEAGGTFTDWSGHPTVDAGEGIGTNGDVLKEVLAITRPYAHGSDPRQSGQD